MGQGSRQLSGPGPQCLWADTIRVCSSPWWSLSSCLFTFPVVKASGHIEGGGNGSRELTGERNREEGFWVSGFLEASGGTVKGYERRLLKKKFNSFTLPGLLYWLSVSDVEASDVPYPSPHVSCVVPLEFGLQPPPVGVLVPLQFCLQVMLYPPHFHLVP